MHPRRTAAFICALGASILLIAGCGGGSTASTDPVPTAPASASPTSAAPTADASTSSGTGSAALSEAANLKAVAVFLAECQKITDITGTPDEDARSCTLSVTPAFIAKTLESVCVPSEDGMVIGAIDEATGNCLLSAKSNTPKSTAAVEGACSTDSLDPASGISATFDPKAGTCAIGFDRLELAKSLCDQAPPSSEPSIDEEAATCTISATPALNAEQLAQDVADGKITCTDGSPASKPSDACIIAYLGAQLGAL